MKYLNIFPIDVYLKLFFLSIFVVLLVSLGLGLKINELKFNALKNNALVGVVTAGNVEQHKNLTVTKDTYELTCHIEKGATLDMCGVVFIFELNPAKNKTVSLKDYDMLDFDISSFSGRDLNNATINIVIKSLINDNAWNNYETKDTKYQAVRVSPIHVSSVPLKRFRVETWWADKFNISYENADLDFSKVISVEFYIGDIPLILSGDYKITIKKFDIIGSKINYSDLILVLSIYWPVFLFGCLIHYSWYSRKQLRIAKHHANFDKETGFFNIDGFLKNYTDRVSKWNGSQFYLVKIMNYHSLHQYFGKNALILVIKNMWGKVERELDANQLLIFRVSENEFAIICNGPDISILDKNYLLNLCDLGVVVPGVGHLTLEIIIGVIQPVYLSQNPLTVLDRGRIAIQQAEQKGVRTADFDLDAFTAYEEEVFIEASIKYALLHNEFYLQYMPLWDAKKQRICGAEALLRSTSKHLKDLSPEKYITIAEKTGLIKEIDLWVLESCLKTFKYYQSSLPSDFRVSINMSSREMLDKQFIFEFKKLLRQYDVSPRSLCLEITETFFVKMENLHIKSINEIREMGCHVSLDDFGTGYTSFNYLMKIPVDEIKIDRSFVSTMEQGYSNTIIESILNIASSLHYSVVAEGVETKSQLDSLYKMGCRYFQGYLISKPTDFSKIIALNDELSKSDVINISR